MKIWIITPGRLPVPASRGGAVETLIELLLNYNETYEKQELHVVTISDENAVAAYDKYKYTQFHSIKQSKLESFLSEHHILPYRMLDIFYSLKVILVLKKQGSFFDSIVIENEIINGIVIRKFIHGNYIYHAHNDLLRIGNLKEHIFLNSCERVITISDFLRRKWEADVNPKNMITVHNGVNIDIFKNTFNKEERASVRKQYGIQESDTVVVYAGRLVREKGIECLIDAFQELPENIKLLILGSSFFENSKDKPFVNKIKTICENRNNQIIFTGYISHENMPKYYSMADIGCVPSLWEEPFGLTVIEQMAMELPIITTDAGAIPELVEETCGFIFTRNDDLSRNIASAIIRLGRNPELCKKLGKAGRDIAVRKFNQQIFCEKWFEAVNWRNKSGKIF